MQHRGQPAMTENSLFYAVLMLASVFISALSQVMLKKSAMQQHSSHISEYLNPLVITAYVIFVIATLLSIYSYKGLSLSVGQMLEATSYIYVTFFGVTVFHEKITTKKLLALALIIGGILIYSF